MLKIEGNGMYDQLAVDSKVDLRTVGRLSLAQCREFKDECRRFELAGVHPLTPRDKDLLYVFTDNTVDAFEVHVEPIINEAKLGKDEAADCFAEFIDSVREAMEQYDIPLRNSLALITALDKLLHFDIDVTVARHAARKLAEEMEADE